MKTKQGPQPEFVGWSKNHVARMAINGVWAVPRCGIIFTKINATTLHLTARMPWSEEMKAVVSTPQDLLEYQEDEYQCIKDNMALAGITVEKSPNLKT